MTDFYEILGVPPEASMAQIKSEFRRKAKKLHPDLAARVGGRRASEGAMRLLLDAYRVLSDPERRRIHDRALRRNASEVGGFDYHAFLKARHSDPASQAKLVIYDLLHGREDEALEVLERARSLGDFRLERWLDRGEAMDARFCIAEEYERRGRILKAYLHYRRLIEMEAEKPWFRYFFDVVALRFRTVLLQKLPKVLDDEDYLDRLDEAAELLLPCNDLAQILRKKAEVHIRHHQTEAAIEAIARAAELEPRLAGLPALRKRAGISSARSQSI
ncbi:MAG: DnaJ domain-containing protein [Spirochaetota bacterium]